MYALRPEVLRFPRPDGGLDLLDLLFERLVPLDAAEAAQLDAGAPEIAAKLESLFLVEGAAVVAMRQAAWASRARSKPAPAVAAAVDACDWSLARSWPAMVADEWREPERVRRLAEERSAGRRYLMLPGFVAPAAAAR